MQFHQYSSVHLIICPILYLPLSFLPFPAAISLHCVLFQWSPFSFSSVFVPPKHLPTSLPLPLIVFVCLRAAQSQTVCPGEVSHSSCRMNVIINSYHWGTFVSWTDRMWRDSLNSSLVACHNWSLSCFGREESVWWDLLDAWRWIHFIEFISSMVRCNPSFVARGLHSSAWPCVPFLCPLFHTLTSPFSALLLLLALSNPWAGI